MKKEAETRRNVHIGWGDAKLSPLEYDTKRLGIGVFLLLNYYTHPKNVGNCPYLLYYKQVRKGFRAAKEEHFCLYL